MFDKRARAPSVRGSTEVALIGAVAVLFNLDGSADLQQKVRELAVVALARCRQTPVMFGKLCNELLSAVARLPDRRPLLRGSVGVVVVGIVRPPRTVDGPLKTADLCFLQGHVRCQFGNPGVLLMEVRQAARTGVDPHDFRLRRVDLAHGRKALDHDLRIPPLHAVDSASHDPAILHAPSRRQGLLHVGGVGDEALQHALAPNNGTERGLEDDLGVARSLDGIETSSEGLEARTARALEHVGIQRLEDGFADVLRLVCADVVSSARPAVVVGDGHQTVLGEGVLPVDLVEGFGAFLPLGHVPRIPPLLRFAHALQTAERRPERRVVDRAPEVEGLFEKTILLIVDPKRNFDDEGRSGGSHEDNYTSHETSKRLVPLLK